MKRSYCKYVSIFFAAVLLSACGGGGGGGDDGLAPIVDNSLSGVFIDSEVKGLRWESGDLSGTTDDAGTFKYNPGATVKFYVGDILIGEAAGDSVIIPVDIVAGAQDVNHPAVTNIVRFLMTLDNDGNPSNGIEITEQVTGLASGQSINFNVTTSAFTDSGEVQVLVSSLTAATVAGARALISVTDALAHIQETIGNLLAGNYSGTYAGDGSGSWTGTVSPVGEFSGTAKSNVSGEVFIFFGTVRGDGSGATNFTTSGAVNDGTVFIGKFEPNGSVSGSWSWYGEESGTWSGSKAN